jgi:hypothetical protein
MDLFPPEREAKRADPDGQPIGPLDLIDGK